MRVGVFRIQQSYLFLTSTSSLGGGCGISESEDAYVSSHANQSAAEVVLGKMISIVSFQSEWAGLSTEIEMIFHETVHSQVFESPGRNIRKLPGFLLIFDFDADVLRPQ